MKEFMLQVRRLLALLRLRVRSWFRKAWKPETVTITEPLAPPKKGEGPISNRTRKHRYHIFKHGAHPLHWQHQGTFSPIRPFKANHRVLA